ncbi:MAG TPA: GNAT family N-acetyltransferase, partial [Chloroflexota bacterium]|nr:GNAT family N-acetyltransferase [Chloroflexota bacterium]
MTTTSPQPARWTEPGQVSDYAIRTFREEDRRRLVEIGAAIDPDEKGDLESWRYHDEQWNHDRFFLLRLVAERTDGTVLGWGQVQHMPWQFHPEKYALDLQVDPTAQGRGIGSALLEQFMAALHARGAKRVRAAAKESRANSMAFLMHRGFAEIQRYW